jgi:STE24 endopeptidase
MAGTRPASAIVGIRAQRRTMGTTMEDRARSYHRWQLVLGGASLLVTLAVLAIAAWVAPGLGLPVGSTFAELARAIAITAVVLGTTLTLAEAPIALVAGYWLPRRFDLLHQPFRGWLWDRIKAGVIGGALALLAIEIIYALLWALPLWWLAAAAIFFTGYALLAMVVPVWIVPLFYRLTPLDDTALRARLMAVAARAGVAVVGVWVADQSRKSRTANAGLTGIGRTRRIILFDTLIAHFTPAEIESVLAHELGHHVHGDIRRGLLAQGLLTLVTFWVADRLLRVGVGTLGLAGPADPAGLPWLALILTVLGLVAAPLANGFSRWIERQADDFALAMAGEPDAFIGAMERLAALNLAERRPHRLKELLLYSHPAIDRRIARARDPNARRLVSEASRAEA